MKVTVSDLQSIYKLEKWPLRQAVQNTIRYEKASGQSEVTVALVDDVTIARLNLSYRGQDSATDVLSFNLAENDHPELKDYLGDIVVSVETAAKQAQEGGRSLTREIEMLLVHGTLHLLGYDDETNRGLKLMIQKQDAIMRRMGGSGAEDNEQAAAQPESEEQAPAKAKSASRRNRRGRGRRKKEKSGNAQQETD